MKSGNKLNPSLVNWLLIFGAWTLAALFMVSHQSVVAAFSQNPISLQKLTLIHLASTYSWFALTPLILWLARRFPVGREKFYSNVFIQVICGVSLVLLQMVWDALIIKSFEFLPNRPFASLWDAYSFLFITQFPWNISIYCTVLGITFGTQYYRKFRERELAASRLQARLSQARMHVLKMQLHPHFLFNTHNAISVLIYKDPEAAERMLTNLSDLLRMSLEKLEVVEVPFEQELDFLNKYLEIEQTRFQDRLQVKFDIAPETRGAIVPNMILQPLVENAIKHGIAPSARGGTIKISAAKENQNLCLLVSDDGIGVPFSNPAEIIEGIGLSNTRARLEHLYGSNDHIFKFSTADGGNGFRVKLAIPFKEVKNASGAFRIYKQLV